MKIYTIGHSTRSSSELVNTLMHYHIEIVVDVRTIPKSRHEPQFQGGRLEQTLEQNGMSYIHIPQLGGIFRGYADHMETAEFESGLFMLKKIAGEHTTAIMCAEAVPWRCHRNLIADALTIDGWEVEHIMTERHSNTHELTKSPK